MGGKELIVIVGPTGSGKSSLSMALAAHYGCPIVSTDSRQFYRHIPIGTAQPTQEDLAEAEHHFIACRELADDYNAGQYEKDVLARLEELFLKHDRVVAVGGSGLYIKALCEGLDALPDVSDEVRDSVRKIYADSGLEPLLEELKSADPEFYEQVDRCNHARVMRAVEMCRTSADGKYSTLRAGSVAKRPFNIVKVGLDLPREELYERINLRVEQMLLEGLESEARAVYPLRELNSLQTVGYREMFDFFDGTLSLEEAVELVKRNSRRYAKRQMTWFRRDDDIEWFTQFDPEKVIGYIDSLRR
ncbi:MAG: tRNA (adenosine(37)-N6)-dimethylallyltransferase MiaA [Rikenellaceae bacterium]